jgi:hypothetical protein
MLAVSNFNILLFLYLLLILTFFSFLVMSKNSYFSFFLRVFHYIQKDPLKIANRGFFILNYLTW